MGGCGDGFMRNVCLIERGWDESLRRLKSDEVLCSTLEINECLLSLTLSFITLEVCESVVCEFFSVLFIHELTSHTDKMEPLYLMGQSLCTFSWMVFPKPWFSVPEQCFFGWLELNLPAFIYVQASVRHWCYDPIPYTASKVRTAPHSLLSEERVVMLRTTKCLPTC